MSVGALWRLGRPRLVLHLLAMVFGGYGWAHWNRALPATGADQLAWVVGAWVALHFGTMWLNAAVDRDEGEVFFGEAVPVPPHAAASGYAALAVAVLLATRANPFALGLTALCAALSVAYSHPSILWKGHPVMGPVVNVVGYGIATPAVGWSCVGVPADPRTLAMLALVATAVLGAYFAAQAFQEHEDRARGYRTLVVTHGPRAAVDAASALLGAAWMGLMVLAAVGWLPRPILLLAPGWWWVQRLFVAWREAPGGGSEAWARELARRVGLLSLALFALVFAEYARESIRGEPVAGFGTASGHPVSIAPVDVRARPGHPVPPTAPMAQRGP